MERSKEVEIINDDYGENAIIVFKNNNYISGYLEQGKFIPTGYFITEGKYLKTKEVINLI